MTLRIDRRETGQGTLVELHGWLGEEMLPELQGVCESSRDPLLLDLTDLVGADEAGLRALRRLVASGARPQGASPYIQLLLESED